MFIKYIIKCKLIKNILNSNLKVCIFKKLTNPNYYINNNNVICNETLYYDIIIGTLL